ncbi:uncharacterized protein LOC114450796 [Parambassis ranga]|uniref:Uncharacterized protein LOC114450796 n=1 Tax=Parambassis ranga TaxID=210632 RepID=A0A6P7K916_9TELE|nr:uncharacterized protein LOC114450796 [Parambassis ranga]
MPQNGLNLEGRRRWTHHSTCKAKDVFNGQFPGSGSFVEAGVHNDRSAAGSKPSESTPADTLQSPKPPRMVNGYINHGYKDRNTKAAPSKTQRKQQGTKSAAIEVSAAGRISGASVPGGISVNGDARLDTATLPHNFVQSLPNSSLSATGKDQRRRKKIRHKKRIPLPPPPPPQEEEDWEAEIQEVTLDSWDKMCIGIKPNGPEDLLHFALWDLTLKQRNARDLPVTASYSPSLHHPRPIKWSCCSRPTEPDQFADAD